MLLDEWQEVPGVLGAVKRAVDAAHTPGRFILTGSVHAELNVATWPRTGRIIDVAMGSLTMRELVGDVSAPPFLDRIAQGSLDVPSRVEGLDLRGYIDAAVAGGYPEAVLLPSAQLRRRWFATYVRQLMNRDALGVSPGRDPLKLRRFLMTLALNSACIVTDQALFGRIDIDRKTAHAYEGLLRDLFIAEAIPAWSHNRLKRLTQAPKRYLTDTGLTAALTGVDSAGVLRDGKVLGQLLDTFVIAQLRAELAVSQNDPAFYHLREKSGGREIDLIVEYAGGWVVGIEIKASNAPDRRDARHLAWLREELGDQFIRGIVLHTGRNRWRIDERIEAIPIAAIWS
ncbi:MAG: ATP-binding protein [Mycobacteriales bacterium]